MAPTLGQLKPGSKCSHYEIVRLIGAGGMGEVYMALHEFTKKPVALKVLKVDRATNQYLIDKMRSEAMVLCRIRHRNLVEVFDAGINDGRMIWMAMELLDGESLRERMVREASVRPSLAFEWTAQAADGVQAAHDASVIHRDLKPENVFLTRAGSIHVLDFGTAKFGEFQGPNTATADRMGTVPYMSPEHLGGETLDGRSDVFALGMILYEMLAGRHPYAKPGGGFPPMDQMVAMMLAGEPASLARTIGERPWQVLSRALAQDRNQRHPSMSAFATALRDSAAHLPDRATSGIQRIRGTSDLHLQPPQVAQHTPAPVVGPAPQTGGMPPATVLGLSLLAAGIGAAAVLLTAGGSGSAAHETDTAAANDSAYTSASARPGASADRGSNARPSNSAANARAGASTTLVVLEPAPDAGAAASASAAAQGAVRPRTGARRGGNKTHSGSAKQGGSDELF